MIETVVEVLWMGEDVGARYPCVFPKEYGRWCWGRRADCYPRYYWPPTAGVLCKLTS